MPTCRVAYHPYVITHISKLTATEFRAAVAEAKALATGLKATHASVFDEEGEETATFPVNVPPMAHSDAFSEGPSEGQI